MTTEWFLGYAHVMMTPNDMPEGYRAQLVHPSLFDKDGYCISEGWLDGLNDGMMAISFWVS